LSILVYTTVEMIDIQRDDTTDPNLPKLTINVNNGDLKGLDKVMDKWHFADEENMLRFAIAVLLSAENNRLYADGPDGKKITLKPIDSLLKSASDDTTEATTNDKNHEQ
jgi:hypothetical protein